MNNQLDAPIFLHICTLIFSSEKTNKQKKRDEKKRAFKTEYFGDFFFFFLCVNEEPKHRKIKNRKNTKTTNRKEKNHFNVGKN
jgi:hypothetical protein